MSRLDRRTFLKGAAATAAAGFVISGTKSSGQVFGSNETINVGVMGINGRGGGHVSELLALEGVRISHLIDVDTRTYGKYQKRISEKYNAPPKTFQDIRRALDDKGLDAITIATPNHWHSLGTIWACQAGKDVYVEKPLCHEVQEGRIAVETARKYNRIVQHGTQGRSQNLGLVIQELCKQGTYGKLLISRGLCYKSRTSIGFKEITEPPAEVDFDIWLGPAPKQPFHANLVHYNWHWFWDFGNGDIGNQGVHEMDKARWGIPGGLLPKSVMCIGGRFGYKDQGQTPNTQISVLDYGDTLLMFEVRGLKTDGYYGEKVGNTYHFEKGVVSGDKFYPNGSQEGQPLPKLDIPKRGPGKGHMGNFIAAMRSRKVSDLNADVIEGYYSCAPIHLSNISYRLGEDAPFSKASKAFGDNKAAYDMLERMQDHLKQNSVPLDGLMYHVGKALEFDPKTAKFVDDDKANEMLTRKYRKPFVVPDKVV